MRWIFFIIFVVLFFRIVFIVKMDKMKVLKLYSIGFIAIPIILILISMLVVYVCKTLGKMAVLENLRVFFITFTFSLMTFCFLALSNLLPPLMVDFVIGFHKRYNSANMNRQPLKFFVQNESKIKSGFSYSIFIGSILIFYAIWFKLKL